MQSTSRAEAERLVGMAANLLSENDLNSARDFALLAQETDPLLDTSDQIMAIVDVLISANKDFYATLQIDMHQNNDHDHIKQQYRRLAILLHPDKNHFSFASKAYKLVSDAWNVLSDPTSKKAYDEETFHVVRNQNSTSQENIWTLCPYCYNLYEYPRMLEGCCLRCENCERAFQVVGIPTELMPVMVPGKEAYYCSRQYFPIGIDNVAGTTPPEKNDSGSAGATAHRKKFRPVRNPLS